MDPDLELLLLGLSHRTAPVEVRERCSIPLEELESLLGKLAALDGVAETAVISTCNRTEVLVAGHDVNRLAESLHEHVFADTTEGQVYTYRDIHAVIHLFRVASGLDSLVLGESQILAQVKDAMGGARRASTLGRLLEPLFQQALSVGKRVRTETEVGEGTLSVARVGVDLAAQVFGSFEDCRALVVGAGETAALVARHLASRGVKSFTFVNRTPENAIELAGEFDGHGLGLDALPAALKVADLVLACVDGAPGLVSPELFDRRALTRRDRPLLVIDLSVPRAVSREVADLKGLIYYDLDDLGRVVEQNRRERQRATAGSDEILVAEVHKFLSLRTYATFSPVIADLREDFTRVRESVLAENPDLTSDEMVQELERRLLDVALSRMKDSARRTQAEGTLTREYERFLEGL